MLLKYNIISMIKINKKPDENIEPKSWHKKIHRTQNPGAEEKISMAGTWGWKKS
jgi:hypothetical protein